MKPVQEHEKIQHLNIEDNTYISHNQSHMVSDRKFHRQNHTYEEFKI